MAANGASSLAISGPDKGMVPPNPPLLSSSEAFPPLPQSAMAAQARSRRIRAQQRQPYPPSSNSRTAFSAPGSSVPANSGSGHPSFDAWQEPQLHFQQPMAAQQHSQTHVFPDASFWQHSRPQPAPSHELPGLCHVADPAAHPSVIRGNTAPPMASNHVSYGTCAPSFHPASWQAMGQPGQQFG